MVHRRSKGKPKMNILKFDVMHKMNRVSRTWYQFDEQRCVLVIYCVLRFGHSYIRADYRFAPSQRETALLCNDVSHWLGAKLESNMPMMKPGILLLITQQSNVQPVFVMEQSKILYSFSSLTRGRRGKTISRLEHKRWPIKSKPVSFQYLNVNLVHQSQHSLEN